MVRRKGLVPDTVEKTHGGEGRLGLGPLRVYEFSTLSPSLETRVRPETTRPSSQSLGRL